MEVLEYSLKYKVMSENSYNITAIVTCAGSSQRMNGINKQFAKVGGVPVIVRSVMAFQKNENINSVVISAKPCDIPTVQNLVAEYNLSKVTDIVEGGATRAESVKNAFSVLCDNIDYVLIHDGARPLVSQTVINQVIEQLPKHKAVACSVPVKDTIKQVGTDGKTEKNVDREKLAAMQTPQGFSYELYKTALERITDFSLFTDDCSVVENSGTRVFLVSGDYKNIKITTKEDLITANALAEENIDD